MRSFLGIARTLGLLPCALALAACSSESNFQASPSFAGEYTVSVTNGDNGCMIDNWQVGSSASGIGFTLEQQGKNLNGTIEGLAAIALLGSLGTNQFVGTASGSDFDLTAYGKIMRAQDTCMYELNAEIQGHLSGDAITGTIKYAPALSSDPACGSVQCSSSQDFNGTRPPS